MARRYSKVSNYALGKSFRMVMGAVLGFVMTWNIVPRLTFINPNHLLLLSLLVGVMLASVAARHT